MVSPLSSWRTSAFAGFLALLSLGLACHKDNNNEESSTAGTVTISGKLTYARIPLVTDPATGIPTGLEADSTKFVKSPARGIAVRVYQQVDATGFDGSTYPAWVLQSVASSGSDGGYSITLTSGRKTFVEIVSCATYFDSTGARSGELNVFAEPDGMSDPTLESDRLVYAIRKGVDGSLQTAPLVLPGTLASSNAVVNFDLGLTDPWWVTPRKDVWTDALLKDATKVQLEGPSYAKNPNNAGTGSRVLAILDSGYAFAQAFGNPSPNGYALDLHYFYNCNATQPQPFFSYVDYDVSTYPQRLPQAFDGRVYRFFGAIQGGSQSDDAFDEGILFSIFSKNKLLFYGGISVTPTLSHAPGDPQYLLDLQDLRPDLALVEGLHPAMAASLLKSPYLADSTGQPGGGLNPVKPYRDIRDTAGIKQDAFSAPSLTRLAWDIILKANAIANPGTATTWADIDEAATFRFFAISPSYYSNSTIINDIPNIFHQLSRLQETLTAGESMDLKAIFTDSVLTSLLAPYNIPWPRPTTTTAPNSPYLSFMPFWETDPNSQVKPLPPLTLSMAYAHQDRLGKFPNVSWGVNDPIHPTQTKGEVFTGVFSLTKDTVYDLSLNTSPAIPASATVEVSIGAPNLTGTPSFSSGRTYSFGTASPTQHYQVTLGMAGISITNRPYVPILVRLVSPDTQQPTDLNVTVNLVPTR